MRTLSLQSLSLEKSLNATNLILGGSVTDSGNERILEFDNEYGTGTIKGITLEGGLSYLQYDVCFRDDFKISTDPTPAKPLYFMYCLKGHLYQCFQNYKDRLLLDEFQTAIMGGTSHVNEIVFPSNQRVKLCIIRAVDRTTGEDSNLPSSLKETMVQLFSHGKEQDKPIRYFGTYNLRIGEQLAQLEKIKQVGLVKKLLIEGILNLTLAMEIEHLRSDLENEQNPTGSLTQYELKCIKEVSRKIEEHPEIQYSIKSLCLDCGLSASKLQEGFKLLHGKTVSDFIRNERLNTAERLISTTDMNISEIVYTVGLSSRSYFSKIFKRRYNCSPKMYQDNKKSLAATA
ncbi:helix-turn-helix domain-containing protein [Euzebyella marina]|uniref:Helix-turn-helix domain-containing protein n=1 Tax=Euzebyella marina TaxID=1761453 RepID=A0A3G2L9I8_9FLAO|nr:helix-turn-helix domain-containing protein [Euzebyella marina]AYN68917.1 helix-turn-helix domain-containing protein [Euzebyella marina]MAU72003.1 AraC family transcriptional regulator [Pseudozobellia sp.]MBG47838.1 AraC family transcriptional regulator [Pseudozobellia sp.]|tara:strand:+ start:1028 stop:2059 length:1032 start_codon:yes stop_codon:yes gene_type:complete